MRIRIPMTSGKVFRTIRRVVAFAGMLVAPFAGAHGTGTTGGKLVADRDGLTVTLTLSVDGLLSAGLITPAMSERPGLFDAHNRPDPELVENTRALLVVRSGDTVIPATISPGPDDGIAGRAVALRWNLPPGARRFDIARRDPDGTGGIAVWMFSQIRTDGGEGETRFAETTYGDAVSFPLTPAGADDAPEPVVETTSLGVLRLLGIGFRHIIPEGFDHVLFMLALFLPLPRLRPLAAQATAFTLAHSVTLGLAMAGLVRLPSRPVEAVIAASIVVMALENLKAKRVGAGRWSLVFVFGLVHGLGFAGSFSHLAAKPGDFGRTLVFLNLGIELAQLAILCALAALVAPIRDRPWYRTRVTVPVSLAVAAVAGVMLAQRAGLF